MRATRSPARRRQPPASQETTQQTPKPETKNYENTLRTSQTPPDLNRELPTTPIPSSTLTDSSVRSAEPQYSQDTDDKEAQSDFNLDSHVMSPLVRHYTSSNSTISQNIIDRAKGIHREVNAGKSVTKQSKNQIQKLAMEIVELARLQMVKGAQTSDQTPTTSLTKDIEDLTISNQAVTSEINSLKAEMDIIKGSIRNGFQDLNKRFADCPPITYDKPTQHLPSYSDQAKKPARNLPRNNPAIVATLTNAKSGAEALNTFKQKISFKECNYAPIKIRPVTNNKIRIEFDNATQCDETLKRINSGDQITAEPAKNLIPMCILKGIHKNTPIRELEEIIISQNPTVNESIKIDETLQLCFIQNNRNENLYNAVFKCPPAAWRAIMNLGRLNIDHQRVHVSEHSPFKQCLICLQYGHTKTHCKATITPCSHCAETSHNYKQCPHKNSKPPQCYNCISHNNKFTTKLNTQHTAINPSCPRIVAAKTNLHQKINYAA